MRRTYPESCADSFELLQLQSGVQSTLGAGRTQLFNPDGNMTDCALFGQVGRRRDPRLIQLASKLTF
jgi:hypothetical protein